MLFLFHLVRYHLRLTAGTFPQALTPLGNPVGSRGSAADSVNAAETSALWWQCGEASAKDWGWSLSLLCRKGLFLFVLEPCPSPGTILAFFSASHITLSLVTIWRKKKSRGISHSLTTKEFLNCVL